MTAPRIPRYPIALGTLAVLATVPLLSACTNNTPGPSATPGSDGDGRPSG